MMENFKIDFSKIDRLKLRDIGITEKEVLSIFFIENTCFKEFKTPDHHFFQAIGYLDGNKFLMIAYDIPKDVTFEIEVLQIGIPNAEDIKRYWCK